MRRAMVNLMLGVLGMFIITITFLVDAELNV